MPEVCRIHTPSPSPLMPSFTSCTVKHVCVCVWRSNCSVSYSSLSCLVLVYIEGKGRQGHELYWLQQICQCISLTNFDSFFFALPLPHCIIIRIYRRASCYQVLRVAFNVSYHSSWSTLICAWITGYEVSTSRSTTPPHDFYPLIGCRCRCRCRCDT